LRSQKRKAKNRARVIFHQGRPTGAIALNFGILSDIADVITPVKFHVNCFMGFGVLRPPTLPFFVGLAGRPGNNVSTIPSYTVTGLVIYLLTFLTDFATSESYICVKSNLRREQLGHCKDVANVGILGSRCMVADTLCTTELQTLNVAAAELRRHIHGYVHGYKGTDRQTDRQSPTDQTEDT